MEYDGERFKFYMCSDMKGENKIVECEYVR